MAQPVKVTVTKGVDITVDPDSVKVPKNTDVEWKGVSSQEFNIVLPSGESRVSCGLQGGKWVCTGGPFQNNTGKNRKIKYIVTSPGTPTLDPEVDIQP